MNRMALLASPAGASSPAVTPPAKAPDPLSDKTTFLKLLVSQIKNQNPLNPQDGTQFLAQLAQFSQVEQLVGIRQDLDDMKTVASNATTKALPAN